MAHKEEEADRPAPHGGRSRSNIYNDFRHQKEMRERWMHTDDERLHQAVLEEDEDGVRALLAQLPPELTNARDRYGNPPLHLAVHLQNTTLTRLLLESRADITWKNGGGWTVVQEAVATRNAALTGELLQEVKSVVNLKFEERIQQAIAALQEVPDFYMELGWAFSSWLPLVSKFCPSDNYRIWKKGSCVRVDTTLIGFENLKWVRGRVSFLFSGTPLRAQGTGQGSHVAIINHEARKVEFALESFKQYSLGHTQPKNLQAIMDTPLTRLQILYEAIHFAPCRSWLGHAKTETVGPWSSCSLYDVTGIQRLTTKRVAAKRPTDEPATPEERAIDPTTYHTRPLDPEAPKGVGLLHTYETRSVSVKNHTAKLWLSPQFPVRLEELLPVFAILSPNGKHFEKLKEFLSVPLPGEGFPVKIEIPVFPTISGTATFGLFQVQPPELTDDLFHIPADYRILSLQESMIFQHSRRRPAPSSSPSLSQSAHEDVPGRVMRTTTTEMVGDGTVRGKGGKGEG